MKLFAIVGAGGFGREVIPLAEKMLQKNIMNSQYQLVFVEEKEAKENVLNNYPVITLDDFFAHPASQKYFNIAIASAEVRKRIAERIMKEGGKPFSIFAEDSLSITHNDIGEGAILCPFTMVTANAKIGKFFHANIYSYVAHDCTIGDYVTFAPNVNCNGSIVIEDEVYVGSGAIIKQGTPAKPIVIGKGAIIGMGAVVTKSVDPYTTVIGNPARPLEQTKKLESKNVTEKLTS